jgi:TrmH family RNA methyltransferase
LITSPDNQKLKLVRRLADRRFREREGFFVTEGEDLLAAGLAAGEKPEAVLTAPGSGIDGEEVEPRLLADASRLGSGTRAIGVWRQRWSAPEGPADVYLHGVADPGNVGTVIRTAHALVDGRVVLGPGCADPYGPKAVRASMGSIFACPPARAEVAETRAPRAALVAHGGEPLGDLRQPLTLCLGAEREGLPEEVLAACERTLTIPLHPGGAESLNVAAAAAIACERISSPAKAGVSQ